MLTGVAGMLLPRRGYGWLRRRMVLRRGPGGRPVVNRVDEKRYPPYVMLNPGTAAMAADEGQLAAGEPPTLVDPPQSTVAPPAGGHEDAAEWEAAQRAVAEWEAAEEAASPGEARPAEEVVEEYVEE
jgi:hypothetical protein